VRDREDARGAAFDRVYDRLAEVVYVDDLERVPAVEEHGDDGHGLDEALHPGEESSVPDDRARLHDAVLIRIEHHLRLELGTTVDRARSLVRRERGDEHELLNPYLLAGALQGERPAYVYMPGGADAPRPEIPSSMDHYVGDFLELPLPRPLELEMRASQGDDSIALGEEAFREGLAKEAVRAGNGDGSGAPRTNVARGGV